MTDPNPFAQKLVTFCQVTGELLKRAQAQQDEKRAQEEIVKQRIPEAVDALVTNERIFPHQKEAVAKGCEDPGKVLELLRDVAAHRTAGEVEKIGSAVEGNGGQVKTGAAGQPLGGRVANWDDTESGQRFRQRVMGGSS
jgi:hypothetical protein